MIKPKVIMYIMSKNRSIFFLISEVGVIKMFKHLYYEELPSKIHICVVLKIIMGL